jgi:hypothetical protein
MLRRRIRDTVAEGCWTQGTLMELRQSQAAGAEGPRGVTAHFGTGHLAVRSGGVVYVARCGMVVVELRNHTTCKQEIPVTHQGREMYGTTESGDPAVSDSCKVREENSAPMEDREEVVLRISRNPAMQWSRTIARAPSYKCPRDE